MTRTSHERDPIESKEAAMTNISCRNCSDATYCSHRSEPGCAVSGAIAAGALEQEQWSNYLQLQRESRFPADKAAYLREDQKHQRSSKRRV
jgi:hypothetical protein